MFKLLHKFKLVTSKESNRSVIYSGQLDLPVPRPFEKDRNYHMGGRSFYFFDFDDNIINLPTPIVLFHKATGKEKKLSSSEYANNRHHIGVHGELADYEIRYDDEKGSYRHFRDKPFSLREIVNKREAGLLNDVRTALSQPNYDWQGPSWNCFYHAVYNKRPISLITARGHSPRVLKQAIRELVRHKHIPHEPNYLDIVPVSHPKTQKTLVINGAKDVASLKKVAIRNVFYKALKKYGRNSYHRFGFSDDDPKNVNLIREELTVLKRENPSMGFFIISTVGGSMQKDEVFADGHIESIKVIELQKSLFD